VSWGVNETGWSENCLWLDGERHMLAQVQFSFDRDNPASRWRITAADATVELEFTPAGCFSEDVDAIVLASRFRQFFGRFDGYVKTADGRRIEIDAMWGFVEDHYSRW
jgi:hypothetical protein